MRQATMSVARRLAIGTAAAGILAAAVGCSSRQLYDSGMGWQRNECHRMPDATERSKCLSSTAMSYDDYKRQSEEVRPGR